jgi:hypothetical protein
MPERAVLATISSTSASSAQVSQGGVMSFDLPTIRTTTIAAELRTFAVVFGLALGSASAQQPVEQGHFPCGKFKDVAVEDLKRAYLLCERMATLERLNHEAIMSCSVVYEQLKQRAFGGDFEKMLAWSKAQAFGQETRPQHPRRRP